MKWSAFLPGLLLIFSGAANAQSGSSTLNKLVEFVEQADSLSNKTQRTFNLVKIGRFNDGLKETWHYTIQNGKVIVFQVRYMIDSIEFTEVYYVNGDRLVCSEEYETIYLPDDDELKFGGIYYFNNNNILQLITLGRRSGGPVRWDLKNLTLDRFKNRYAELRENLLAKNN
jgi:hypothetical protein